MPVLAVLISNGLIGENRFNQSDKSYRVVKTLNHLFTFLEIVGNEIVVFCLIFEGSGLQMTFKYWPGYIHYYDSKHSLNHKSFFIR